MQNTNAVWMKGRLWAALCCGLAVVAWASLLPGCGVGPGPCDDPAVCDDNNACTTDTCTVVVDEQGSGNDSKTCSNTPKDCSTNGGVCNPADGACVECVTAADCDDSDACTTDTCDSNGCTNATITCDSGVCDSTLGCVECLADSDCATGEVCNTTSHTCEAAPVPCTDDSDCDAGEVCSNGACVPETPTGCTDDSDCDADQFCNSSGVCEDNPTPVACNSDADCETLQICSNSVCVDVECKQDSDCDNGDFCDGDETCVNNVCSNGTDPCVAPQICDEPSDSCTLPPEPPAVHIPSNGEASAQVGGASTITGITVSDPDNNTLTVDVASSTGFISFTLVGGVTANGSATSPSAPATDVELFGTIAGLNSTLATLAYTTDRVAGNPGNDFISVTATDLNGGTASKTVTVGVGTNFNLTAGTDSGASFTGTAFGDAFIADAAGELNNDDVLNGAGGVDTLRFEAAAGTGAIPTGPAASFSATGFENVFFNGSAGAVALDLNKIAGISNVRWSPTGAHTLTITNAADAFTLDVDTQHGNTGSTIDVGIKDSTFGSQSFTVRLNGATGTPINVPVVTSLLIETLNFVSGGFAGATGVTNTVGNVTSSAATVNISGSQAFVGTFSGVASRTVNGSGATGALTLTTAEASAVVSGGSANDTLTGGAGAQAFSGNAGNDTIRGLGGNDQATGGAGADTFVFEATAGANGLDTITDFSTSDVLDFTAFAGANTPTATVADTSTANQAVATDNVFVVTDADGSIDTDVEVAALFGGGGKVFAAVAGNENIVLLIQNTQTGGNTTIWYVDNDNNAVILNTECVQVGTLTAFNGAIGDANIKD